MRSMALLPSLDAIRDTLLAAERFRAYLTDLCRLVCIGVRPVRPERPRTGTHHSLAKTVTAENQWMFSFTPMKEALNLNYQ
jgi:hypothetical protein